MLKDKSSRVIKLQGNATSKNRMTVEHYFSPLLSSTFKFPFPFAFHSINHSFDNNVHLHTPKIILLSKNNILSRGLVLLRLLFILLAFKM